MLHKLYTHYKDWFDIIAISGSYTVAALTVMDHVLRVLIGVGTLYLIWRKIKKK